MILDTEFRTFIQGDLSISDYCRKLKTMADQLGSLGNPSLIAPWCWLRCVASTSASPIWLPSSSARSRSRPSTMSATIFSSRRSRSTTRPPRHRPPSSPLATRAPVLPLVVYRAPTPLVPPLACTAHRVCAGLLLAPMAAQPRLAETGRTIVAAAPITVAATGSPPHRKEADRHPSSTHGRGPCRSGPTMVRHVLLVARLHVRRSSSRRRMRSPRTLGTSACRPATASRLRSPTYLVSHCRGQGPCPVYSAMFLASLVYNSPPLLLWAASMATVDGIQPLLPMHSELTI